MDKLSSSSVVLDVNAASPAAESEPAALRSAADDPFRILILGDFSGAGERAPLAARRPQRIDRDNFDDVLHRMNVRAESLKLSFRELADFDPDSLYRRCEAFRGVAAARSTEAAPAAPRSSIEADIARLTSGSLLDDIVEQSGTPPEMRRRPRDEMQALVERVAAPHLVPREDDAVIDARRRTLAANQALMRAILHHPGFQALEAAWRGVDLLVRELDSENGLSIHLLDISKEELARDVENDGGLLERVGVEETVRTPGGQAWAVMIGNYSFDRTAEDLGMLRRLAALARAAGAPFLAEAQPPGDSGAERWNALRVCRDACWLGLALPRFIGRLPYGRATYTIESMEFEEIPGAPRHGDFLWINPAFACALLLGRSYNDGGWRFRPGADREISGLPYFTFESGGERQAQPCAEVLLTDSEIDSLHDQGLMALASIKNRDAAMLMRFHSIADPPCALAGRWG